MCEYWNQVSLCNGLIYLFFLFIFNWDQALASKLSWDMNSNTEKRIAAKANMVPVQSTVPLALFTSQSPSNYT